MTRGSRLPVFVRRTVFGIGTVLCLLAPGCTPTVTALYDARTVSAHPPLLKVAVVAANMAEPDRHALEDVLVAQLRSRGVAAGAAYVLFPTEPSVDEARAALLGQGYEAILRVELETIDRQTVTAGDQDFQWTYVTVRSSLFEAATDDVLWNASLRTTNPDDEVDLAKSVSATLLPALAKAGFLLPVRAPKKS